MGARDRRGAHRLSPEMATARVDLGPRSFRREPWPADELVGRTVLRSYREECMETLRVWRTGVQRRRGMWLPEPGPAMPPLSWIGEERIAIGGVPLAGSVAR